MDNIKVLYFNINSSDNIAKSINWILYDRSNMHGLSYKSNIFNTFDMIAYAVIQIEIYNRYKNIFDRLELDYGFKGYKFHFRNWGKGLDEIKNIFYKIDNNAIGYIDLNVDKLVIIIDESCDIIEYETDINEMILRYG